MTSARRCKPNTERCSIKSQVVDNTLADAFCIGKLTGGKRKRDEALEGCTDAMADTTVSFSNALAEQGEQDREAGKENAAMLLKGQTAVFKEVSQKYLQTA